MITIKLGKLFCKRYNKENGTSLSPKEIFTTVMAPLVWDDEEYLFWNTNDPFAQRKCSKTNTDTFKDALDKFCARVESEEYFGLMTTGKVYGGCAEVGNKKPQSTYCLINDNLYFDIDDRYNSFIGMLLQVCVSGGFNVCLYNEDIVWLLFESMKEYRNYINNNDGVVGRKLSTWNGQYIVSKLINGRIDTNEFASEDGKIKTITITRLLIALAKGEHDIKMLGIHNIGQTNITGPMVVVETEPVRNLYKFYNILMEDNSVGDVKLFDEMFGGNLIYRFIENGAITNGIITDRFVYALKNDKLKQKDFNTIEKKIKLIESIMTKESKEISTELGELVAKCKRNTNKTLSSELNNVFSSKNATQLINSIMQLCDSSKSDIEDFDKVIDYMTNEMSRDEFVTILCHAKFKSFLGK